jgi:hypothetical protein
MRWVACLFWGGQTSSVTTAPLPVVGFYGFFSHQAWCCIRVYPFTHFEECSPGVNVNYLVPSFGDLHGTVSYFSCCWFELCHRGVEPFCWWASLLFWGPWTNKLCDSLTDCHSQCRFLVFFTWIESWPYIGYCRRCTHTCKHKNCKQVGYSLNDDHLWGWV